MTILAVDTPHGPANAHLHPVDEPRAAVVLGHGAGGGVTARDLVTVTRVAREERMSVALVEQGARDPFGIPPPAERRTVVQVASDHSLRTDLEAIGAAVRAWLSGLVER